MRLRTVTNILLASSLCLAVGCEEKKATPDPTPAVTTAAVSQPTVNKPAKQLPKPFARRGPRRHLEPAGMLLREAQKVSDLTDEQKAKLEELAPKRPERGAAPDPNRTDMQKSLAEAVKAGKVDAKKFEEHTAAMAKKAEERDAERVKLLNDLHALLTPDQRKAVTQQVRQRLEQLASKDEGKDGAKPEKATDEGKADKAKDESKTDKPKDEAKTDKPKDEAKTDKATDEAKGPGEPGGMRPDKGRAGAFRIADGPRPGHRPPGGFDFKRMARNLELTDDQMKKVDELTEKMKKNMPTEAEREARREESRKSTLALLEAFEKDTFDAAKVNLGHADDAGARMKKHLESFNAFLAILTEEQRTKLAERFEKRRERFPEHDGSSAFDDLVDEVEPPDSAGQSPALRRMLPVERPSVP